MVGADGSVRLRIDLAYDGSGFYGFARQKSDHPTVQGVLEDALFRIFGQRVGLTCAGRTDRGVHARGQVVHGDLSLDPDVLAGRARRTRVLLDDLGAARKRLDDAVGDGITIWSIQVVPDRFHARFSATRRRYRYRLVDAPVLDPLERFDAWHVRGELALRPMQQAAKHLLGEHDFASFCRKAAGKTTMRRITRTAVVPVAPGEIHVRLEGTAFCHQQVRSIVGCLVEIGQREHDPVWMREVIEARDRSVAAAVAPPQGLVLESVSFGHAFPASPVR